ncbi:MAG: putative peptidoglycan glycosyltransferase FtsW [Candidatus Pacebacteria bacterium]|nr:putative peptidoglycan glycosyltransferase FtsW [Candidatus Paceibacterota bacterium]MDD5357127.1 putative peptidoglycan glycosyltransferase FtsW [Candidatus Paceibacterota bacterium]
MSHARVDKVLLACFAILIFVGFFIFTSASLGLLTRGEGIFSQVAIKQILVGVILGSIAFFITLKTDYTHWRKYAFFIAIASICFATLVFIPGIGFAHGGAKRWIDIAGISLQPAEFLKLGLIIYYAAWLSKVREKISKLQYGLFPLLIVIFVAAVLVLLEPDTGTFLVIFASLVGMFVAGGGRWRDILILFLLCAVGIAGLFYMRPYIRERFLTFLDPARDPLGSGYQIQQSLIAIGSGGFFGRGFGQSVQKFNYLPEPIGDSIFAVAGEEFGFIGSLLLVLLYIFFALRALRMASKVSDVFGRLLVVGIVILIVSQSFLNIGSMLGILPLTGVPLIFVSQGGTALLVGMAEVGILLNISRRRAIG